MPVSELLPGSPERNQIPLEWDFPERSKPRLAVFDIDLEQRFLFVGWPPEIASQRPIYYHGEYAQYLFNENGKRAEYLRHTGDVTTVMLRGDGIQVNYRVREPIGFVQFPLTMKVILRQLASNRGIREQLAYVDFRDYSEYDSNVVLLQCLGFGKTFFPFDQKRQAPEIMVYRKQDSDGANPDNWEVDSSATSRQECITGKHRALFLAEGSSGPKWNVSWRIEDSEFIMTQTEIETGVTKILASPLELNMKGVSQRIFSTAPHQRDEEGLLELPWTNLRREIRVRLGYQDNSSEVI